MIDKHLMTGPKGNSEFCFPESQSVEPEEKQNSLFRVGQLLSVLLYLPTSKIEQTAKRTICLIPAGTQFFRGIKELDRITCESKVHSDVTRDT